MKILTISLGFAVLISSLGLACSSSVDSASSSSEAVSAAAPTPVVLDAESALARMQRVFPLANAEARKNLQKVNVSALPAALRTRFTNAKTPLETFAFAHSDQGDEDSQIVYVLSAPGASTFVGYAVYADATDDADFYAASATAFYSTTGDLLDVQSRSSGVADSDEIGTYEKISDADYAALTSAVIFDAPAKRVKVTGGTRIDAATLPFAAFVGTVQKELEASTMAHCDQGNDLNELVAIKDGTRVIGYVLVAEGGDDSDGWMAAGYATFTAGGELIAREIATDGFADTMDNDGLLLVNR